jgi:hypothetical protein
LNEIKTSFSEAEKAYLELKPLILYLEEDMMSPGLEIKKPVKWLTTDFESLKELQGKVIGTYNG